MAQSSSASSGGVGFAGLLFIVFLVLKLAHVIGWSWWWVTAPLWGGLALVVAFFALASLALVVVTLFDKVFGR